MTIETANRLYELRKKHNLSQEELAEKLGVSRQAVSKWERSEASPDTDNIIALAKIYGLSLDELIYGEKEGLDNKENTESENQQDEADSSAGEEKIFVNIKDRGDTVKIGSNGIVVEEKNGDTVHISFKGIKIDSSDFDDDDDDDDDENDEGARVYQSGDGKVNIKVNTNFPKPNTAAFWLSVPYPIICTILYLYLGFTFGTWGIHWVLFLTIPLYYSLIEAIRKRKFSEFSYPVLVSCAFFYIGLYTGDWHPAWLLFLTIPVYYPIASILDSGIKRIS